MKYILKKYVGEALRVCLVKDHKVGKLEFDTHSLSAMPLLPTLYVVLVHVGKCQLPLDQDTGHLTKNLLCAELWVRVRNEDKR